MASLRDQRIELSFSFPFFENFLSILIYFFGGGVESGSIHSLASGSNGDRSTSVTQISHSSLRRHWMSEPGYEPA